ncbi:DUF4248 domain-containing protein [Parabacteroides bouchesdurhonensis]|uniref:DUF4248 domain-containing protein n=1 Tax=Parabacteroides bouchesdurhonensis TaxID=1936995 RepID=UPI000C849A74|nr:DUF4248 domain-containing protein [Parabacteroides bouchesdurhonensis]
MVNQDEFENSKFKIKSYGITELGLMYNPSLQPDSAQKALNRWIAYNKELTEALHNTGWRKGQRKFTPLQTMQIIRFLGEPS